MSPTTRLLAVGAAAAALVAGLAGTVPDAQAATTVKAIVFPVDGKVTYTDDFGAARTGHTHEGNDLMGKKMMKELAAVDGTVLRVKYDNLSTGGNSVTIKAADGWTYHYIHVNNDTPGTDDGKATRNQAFPPEIVVGAKVHRGQVVAYMGDSGNAESTAPHLHFEIRQPAAAGQYTGTAIDPYQSLRQATIWSTISWWDLNGSATATASVGTTGFSWGTVAGDRGLLCDWDADGADEAVLYRAGSWYLRNGTSSGAIGARFVFGTAGDRPLCGDVDGDGADEPILFRGGKWTVRAGFAATDVVAYTAVYGVAAGDKPVLGDWDGDGDEDLGMKRAETWYVRSTGTRLGSTTATFRFGLQSVDVPVAGDWDGDGDDDAGIFRQGTWYLRSTAGSTGTIGSGFAFGAASGQPLVGAGTDPAKPGIGTFRPRTA